MIRIFSGGMRPVPEGSFRRPWLALTLALSAVAHVGIAAAFWIEHPPQPEAGAVVAVEIVAEAGERSARPATAAAGSALPRVAKPATAPEAKAPAATAAPRPAPEPPRTSPRADPPAAPHPPPAAPAPALTAELRPPVQARDVPAPRATPAKPAAAARRQTASAPAPGAAPAAGPEVSASRPRYGLGRAANPIPRYPEEARERGWEGVVHLSVRVAADGRADAVEVSRSSGYAVLDRAALEAVRRWRFEPARRMGVPIAGTAIVPIRFRLED